MIALRRSTVLADTSARRPIVRTGLLESGSRSKTIASWGVLGLATALLAWAVFYYRPT